MNIQPSNLRPIDPSTTSNEVIKRKAWHHEIIGKLDNKDGLCWGFTVEFAWKCLYEHHNQAVNAMEINKDVAAALQAQHVLNPDKLTDILSSLGLTAKALTDKSVSLKVVFDALREAYEKGCPGVYLVLLIEKGNSSVGHAVAFHLADDVNEHQGCTVTYLDPNRDIAKITGKVARQIDARANLYEREGFGSASLLWLSKTYIKPGPAAMRQDVRGPDVQSSQARDGEQGNPAYTNTHL